MYSCTHVLMYSCTHIQGRRWRPRSGRSRLQHPRRARWGLPHLQRGPRDCLRLWRTGTRIERSRTFLNLHIEMEIDVDIYKWSELCLSVLQSNEWVPPDIWKWLMLILNYNSHQGGWRLLRRPRGWVPGFPHLHCWRSWRSGQVQLPLPQRDSLQPELLHLRLVVQLRLRRGRGSLQPQRRVRCREVRREWDQDSRKFYNNFLLGPLWTELPATLSLATPPPMLLLILDTPPLLNIQVRKYLENFPSKNILSEIWQNNCLIPCRSWRCCPPYRTSEIFSPWRKKGIDTATTT